MVISQFLFYVVYQQHLTIPSLKHYLTPKHLPYLHFFLPFWLQLLSLFCWLPIMALTPKGWYAQDTILKPLVQMYSFFW